jgi:S-adenosylmethionine hydrolase
MEDGEVLAPVIEVDRFGNVGLAIGFKQLAAMVGEDLESEPPADGECPAGRLPAGAQFVVEVVGEYPPEWRARIVRTFGDLEPGELGLIQDSWGQAALALNGASAAELLSARRGVIVRLTPFAGRCQAGWGTTRPGNASPGHPGSEKGGRDRMQPNDGFGEFRSGSRS